MDFKTLNFCYFGFDEIKTELNKEGEEKKFNLAESCTILRFLSDYYNVDEVWYPRNDKFRRALVDQWLDWHHLNSRFAFSNYAFNKLFKKRELIMSNI
jgi:glutathione S-transferase